MNQKLTNPSFSVVLPVRNGEQYIAEAIESILNQTYPHFNILVLENWSHDRTPEIIRSYEDPRIKVIPAIEPLDIRANFNRALDLELHEYMTFIGHDDIFYPQYLAEMSRLIESEPDASLYHAHFHVINPLGDISFACKTIPVRESAREFIDNVHHFKEEVCGSGYIMRSLDFMDIGGFPQLPNLLFADIILWYKLASLSYKVCSPGYLYGFRVHEDSTTNLIQHLPDFYRASAVYAQIIHPTESAGTTQERAEVLEFLRRFINWRIHQILIQLMTAERKQVEVYRLARRKLQALESDSRLFPAYDSKSWILELIVLFPLPVVRQLVGLLIPAVELVRAKLSYRVPPI